MKVYIWSDFQCPFCYMGEKMLEEALNHVELTEPVEIVFKSYQLDPEAPAKPTESMTEHFMSGHDMSLAEAEARMEKISQRAASVGLHYNLAGVQVCNTRDAHRLMKYAATRLNPGKMRRLNFSLFKANFEQNLLLSDRQVLADLAAAVGLDRHEVLDMLAGDDCSAAVILDQEEIDARADFDFIPYMLLANGSVLQGVLSTDKLEAWLTAALAGAASSADTSSAEGCGPEGCSL